MPSWNNQPAVLYHGTDTAVLSPLIPNLHNLLNGFKIDLKRCRPDSDFGRAFYATTNEQQAREWANARVRQARNAIRPNLTTTAVLLTFPVDRSALAGLDTLCFVRPTADYYALVDDCRLGFPAHGRQPPKTAYDVVLGPVRMWPQKLVIFDGDQISFNTVAAIAILPEPTVSAIGQSQSGFI